MTTESYLDLAKKHLYECKEYNIPIEIVVFEIMLMAKDYSDDDVKITFHSLPPEVLELAYQKLNDFRKTGAYFAIHSSGKSIDLTELMARLLKLI